jgi:hypothetical protein
MEVLEFNPSDGEEPQAIPMSGAKAKFLFTVILLSERLTLLRQHPTKGLANRVQ